MNANGPAAVAMANQTAANRAATAERTRKDRLRVAIEAVERCGLADWAQAMRDRSDPNRAWDLEETIGNVRSVIYSIMKDISDGSDEPRYAAALTARGALGRLWEVL